MENFPFGKKIRKIVGIAGISALSMFPSDKSQPSEKEINIPKKEKTEWTQNELSSNENLRKEIALSLTKEESEKSVKGMLDFTNKNIKAFKDELNYRKFNGKSTKVYSLMSNEKILEQIKDLEYNFKSYLKRHEDNQKDSSSSWGENKTAERKAEEIKEVISYYDSGRQWILDNMQNPEYLKRLTQEEEDKSLRNLTDKYIKEISLERIKEASDKNFILSKDIKESYIKIGGSVSDNVGAFYNEPQNTTYFPLESDSTIAVENAIHEYAHKVTRGNKLLSLNTIKLFSNSFDSASVVVNLSSILTKDTIENIVYFSDPTEMYARKKEFDHDLEKLGVKKYEEKFTLEHYLKATKLQKEGKLSQGSNEFLYLIKPGMIIRVMNEIADVGSFPKNSQNLA